VKAELTRKHPQKVLLCRLTPVSIAIHLHPLTFDHCPRVSACNVDTVKVIFSYSALRKAIIMLRNGAENAKTTPLMTL